MGLLSPAVENRRGEEYTAVRGHGVKTEMREAGVDFLGMKAKASSPRADSFTAFVIDQLQGLGLVEARSMFGGKGLYWKDRIFGLIDDGRVYFKVSETTVGRYVAEAAKPFEPWPGHVMKGYYEVPTNILEDADEAVSWAREAWSIPRVTKRRPAKRKAVKRPTGKRSAR